MATQSWRNPYPNALFSLLPLTTQAQAVTSDARNRHLAYEIQGGQFAISIGFHIPSRRDEYHTLARIGRGDNVDIYVGGPTISKFQCSFEVNLDTKVVMLFDRSSAHTTQVDGYHATPFQHWRPPPRKVVIERGLNEIIGMGVGEARKPIQFRLEWLYDCSQTNEIIEECLPGSYWEESEMNPRAAHTGSQDPNTEVPSRMDTGPHTPAQLKMRYKELHRLGSGNFVAVFKALNYDSGKFMAVKKLNIKSDQEHMYARKREVETLARIRHPHILKFIHSEGWSTGDVLIFMELQDGSLGSLLGNKKEMGSSQQVERVAQLVLEQMLQALDFLACHDVIHRDVKPDNILYLSERGDVRFQLGDFGLCNPCKNANSAVGTPFFAAPERDSTKQTPKFDIWSLMVTILWTLDRNGFVTKLQHVEGHDQIISTVFKAAAATGSELFAAMAKVNPEERASAAQLLDKHFKGKGLTTRHESITPLKD